jgi:hypothetical protein
MTLEQVEILFDKVKHEVSREAFDYWMSVSNENFYALPPALADFNLVLNLLESGLKIQDLPEFF